MTYTSKDRPLRFHTVVLLAVMTIVSSIETNAQIFPVQVNPQLTPPYTPYLSDYTAPGSQRLVVRLRVNDPTLAEYRCKLRITIEGVGITLRTKQHFIPQPIVLEGGGIPQLFYGEDLAEYFNPANLDFAGLSPGEFSKTGKLPEGVYRFSFEVLDYNRNTPVSNKGMAIAWVILNDPPILNLPQRDTKINLIDPTNIVFNWTPRHKGSPNAAFTTEYVFRLVEIWPLERNPYDAFLTQVPLYEETTQQQQILYGPAEPALIPGRKYAWQVQAIDIDKRDLFKNQGRSEVFVFQYGDALYAPDNLRLQSANPSNLTVRWDQTTGGTYATNYRIQYREHKNRSSQEWCESQTSDQWKAIPMLKPDTEYEVQVRSEQQFQKSDYSSPKIFKTLPVGENEFVCRDDAPPPPIPAAAGPLFGLSINDVITVGGYEVVIRQVEGGTGQYTGEGMAIIPYLNGAKVRVVFENIRVNEQNMVTSGTVKSYWNPDSKFLLEKKTETLPSQTPTTGEIPVTIATTETLIEITGAAIATITTDEDGDIIVHTTDGKEQELQKGESYSVVDEVGNGYIIDKDGNITKTTDEEAKAAHERSKRNYNLALKFDKGDGTFGFDDLILRDAGNYSALAQHYQQVDDGKFIAWKAVTSSKPDAVSVIPENTSVDLNTIRFEVNAAPLQPQQGVGGLKLQVQGKGAGMVEELIASSGDGEDEQILGKLNLVSYDQLDKTVVIVPVNNAALPSSLSAQAITTQLTEIFSQAVANVRVSVTEKLTVSLDDTFDDGESGMLSNYTGDMKKVINAYGRLQDNTYYLFLVNKPRSGSSALGFMPRSKQAGFIFADNHRGDPTRLIRTMAHELAHGMFNLKHTFTEYPGLGEGNTQNLMDYSQGSELLKYQWDHVHDPQSVIPLFEGDEEGESKSLLNSKYVIVHDELSTKAYATTKGEDAFTQEAITEIDSTLDELHKVNKKTYIYFAYIWFDANNIDKFEDLIERGFNNAYDIVKKDLNTSNFNLLTIVNAKYDRALGEGLKTVSFREKFKAMNGLSPDCVKAIDDYLKSSGRKKFVDGLDDALKERAEKLNKVIKDCEVEVPPEIVIYYKRKGRNEYRTWGEFTILGTDYKGYILERPKGDNPTQLEECKRHPAGTYDLVYSSSETGTEEKFWGVTMCLAEHTAYKLHGGTRVDNSDGCFLINYNSPQFDKYPEAYQAKPEDVCIRPSTKRRANPDKKAVANTYYQHYEENNPAYKLKVYIETMESTIKEKYKVSEIVKKIIIDEQDEIIEQ